MKLSFPSFTQWRSGIIAALTRFPWNILCGITGAACAIVSIHAEHNDWLHGQCARLAMTAALGMPLFFSLRILHERSSRFARWPFEIVGIPLLALWLWAQPAKPFDGPGIIWIRWLLLLAALHFLVAVSAHIGRLENVGFWQFNRRLFLRFCLATLYTGVLTIGLELALLSADKLFQLKLDKMYGDFFFLMVGVFHPAFFVAGVPRDFGKLDADTEYPRGLKAFTQFALAPLVAVYTAILYAYAVKIIIDRSWPHGWVAFPVLLLSGVGILTFLLLHPLRARTEEKWARWFTTNFPRALAPLSILLLLSVYVRVRDYGFTEERYLGIVAAIWILAWAAVFVLRKNAGIRWIPLSLTVIALLSAFGPISAGTISKSSQLARIRETLRKHNLLVNNRAAKSNNQLELASKEETDLENVMSYMISMHGGRTLKTIFDPILPNENWDGLDGWSAAREIVRAVNGVAPSTPLPHRPEPEPAPAVACFYVNLQQGAPINIEGFRRMWRVPLYDGIRSAWNPSSCADIRIGPDHGVLKLATADAPTPEEIPLKTVFENVKGKNQVSLPDQKLTADFQHGSRSFRIVFDSISYQANNPELRIDHCLIYLLER